MEFAVAFIALYVGHHIGDYWVHTEHQARHKGDAGPEGVRQCALHCWSYTATQAVLLAVTGTVTGVHDEPFWQVALALLVSGVTHYVADRREHGLMFWLVRRMSWKRDFLTLGTLRPGNVLVHLDEDPTMERVPLDNPTLGTGAWALDQSWHLFFGCFIPAIVISL